MSRVEGDQRGPCLGVRGIGPGGGDELPFGFRDLAGLFECLTEKVEVCETPRVLLASQTELIDRSLQIAQLPVRHPHVDVWRRARRLATNGLLQVGQGPFIVAELVAGDAEINLRLVEVG